ncbi:MAG: TonB-dependent receptor plug domain-containing protein, partial [Cyclobacteriaceae bacterium]|nr:TonB-dependent receptor plug domain-containing protein [Cyclobacteriaceae bacterium]
MASDLGAQSIQSVRDVVIHGEYKNASIKECFNAIEKNTNYTFNYNEDDLNDTVRINFKSKNKYVSDFLLEISKKGHLKFRQVNNTINVQQLDESDNKKPSVEVIIQGITIIGRVISSEDNEGLPGANVIVKGTSQGTVTDFEGYYKLDVPDENTVLVFSSVGYVQEEVIVGSQTVINMTMTSDITALSEIVITALGIGREQASLGYAVALVDGDELTNVVQENVLNSLSGKVTGVTISSTGGTGSSVSMIIRGASSLANDNQPLFVIDGIPINNTLNNGGGFGENNRVDYGSAISDLNPDDIESMSVLKGASAAALYGSRAGNGVVIITTKSGKKSKGLGVSVSS